MKEANDNSIWYAVCGFCFVVGFLAGMALCLWGIVALFMVVVGASLLIDALRLLVYWASTKAS